LADADVDAVIGEERAYFAPLGEVEWKVFAHDLRLLTTAWACTWRKAT
jgi:hypothetical protein